MKNKKIILPLIIGLVVIIAGAAAYYGGSENLQGYLKLESSDTTTRTTTTTDTRTASEPIKVTEDTTQSLTSYQTAVKSANITSSYAVLAPSSEASLTPIAPRHQSGAEIKRAEPLSQFIGASSSKPNGQYTITKGYTSTVQLSFPTDQNKVYVLDCSVSPQNQAQVAAVLNGNVSYPAVENGHILYAFLAPSSTTNISIAFDAPSSLSNNSTVGYFYGCELNKME